MKVVGVNKPGFLRGDGATNAGIVELIDLFGIGGIDAGAVNDSSRRRAENRLSKSVPIDGFLNLGASSFVPCLLLALLLPLGDV